MKPRCAAKAAAPVRAATWWFTPPAWPAYPSPRTASNRRAAPCTTGRVRPWNTDLADRRAATAATVADAVTVADAPTAADRAARIVNNAPTSGRGQPKKAPTLPGALGGAGFSFS